MVDERQSDPARVQSVEPAQGIGSATQSSSCLSCRRLEGERDEMLVAHKDCVKQSTHAFAVRKMEELSDLVSRIWAASKADSDGHDSIVDIVADLRAALTTAHARIAALEGALNARKSCLAPSDSYDIPCDCCKETARLLKAALAASPDPILGEDTRRRRDALTRSDARQRDRVRRV